MLCQLQAMAGPAAMEARKNARKPPTPSHMAVPHATASNPSGSHAFQCWPEASRITRVLRPSFRSDADLLGVGEHHAGLAAAADVDGNRLAVGRVQRRGGGGGDAHAQRRPLGLLEQVRVGLSSVAFHVLDLLDAHDELAVVVGALWGRPLFDAALHARPVLDDLHGQRLAAFFDARRLVAALVFFAGRVFFAGLVLFAGLDLFAGL